MLNLIYRVRICIAILSIYCAVFPFSKSPAHFIYSQLDFVMDNKRKETTKVVNEILGNGKFYSELIERGARSNLKFKDFGNQDFQRLLIRLAHSIFRI